MKRRMVRMKHGTLIFCRDNWIKNISHKKFLKMAHGLFDVVMPLAGSLTTRIVTCEDIITYSAAKITPETYDITGPLRKRATYSINEFTRDIWKRSLSVELRLTDEVSLDPFCVGMVCDRHLFPFRVSFYGRCIDDDIKIAIRDAFEQSPFSQWIDARFKKVI